MKLLLNCERGVAAVEFAIVSMLFFILLFGGIEMGRTFYVKNQLSYLADQATRAVIINSTVTDATLTSNIRDQFTAGDPTQLTVTILSETVAGTEYRVVQVDYAMDLLIPSLMPSTFSLNVDRRVPVI